MRWRATATITWDLETQNMSQPQALELANKHLGELQTQDGIKDLRLVVRLDKLKEKVEKVNLGEFKIEEVMPFITKEDVKREYESGGVKHAVRMNSHRYFLFRECMNCIACGLPGTKMFLECHPADKSPHFNLYGEEDGKLVLMTKDHIHAKSVGGEDRHSNYQTMCLICNNLKGHSNLTLDGVRELRAVYNENKSKVTKKKLHVLLEETRSKLEQPWTKSTKKKKLKKTSSDAVVTNCDLNLYYGEDGCYGRSVYDEPPKGHKHIGCIKKGVCLEPLIATKDKLMCKLTESEAVILHHSLVRKKDSS